MSIAVNNHDSPDATIELFSAFADQWLAPEKRRELVNSLQSDPRVRAAYIEQAIVHSLLSRKARRDDIAPLLSELAPDHMLCPSGFADELPSLAPSPNSPSFGFLSAGLQSTFGSLPESWLLAYLIATVVTTLGLLICSHIYMSQPEQIARISASAAVVESEPKVEPVGRITGMVDCKWADKLAGDANQKSEIRNHKYLVSLGDKVALASGLLEITYSTGAKVILQGPVTYEVESNGGYLAVGKLTGKLEMGNDEARMTKDEGLQNSSFVIRHSSFVIRTPTATVTDLGTEFGVEVTPNGVTDVHVFQGEVETSQQARSGGQAVATRLVAGEAVRIISAEAPRQRIPFRTTTLTANTFRIIGQTRRSSALLTNPTSVVASAYHRVWGIDGKLLAENDRALAFKVATDGWFGRGENNAKPQSSFDTFDGRRGTTAFVGLLYGRQVRFDRIKVFLGCQMRDGGNWREMPRVFILKHPLDTDREPPERDTANWLELPLRPLLGASFKTEPDANPGMVIEIPLTGSSVEDRTGYGWAVGGVQGNGPSGYVSVTGLRAYSMLPQNQDTLKESSREHVSLIPAGAARAAPIDTRAVKEQEIDQGRRVSTDHK